MDFFNSYEDKNRAEAYAKLGFEGTYYLAFRDIPQIISDYAKGNNALDFGCGTGRSTRFLQDLGFHTVGIDISKEMIAKAQEFDPKGTYLHADDGDFHLLPARSFDLVLSAFTFDNIPMKKKEHLFSNLANVLADGGSLINLVSSPEMYTHEWASFTTKKYPQNTQAKTGDVVLIITKDFDDNRPCQDVFCTEEDYKSIYTKANLRIFSVLKPLATGNEPYPWVNETAVAPWTIYVLQRNR
jgi:ubiquinone/menaquinone biosynthesis C-methylase UbiE